MRLYDNDAYREDFIGIVYNLLQDDGTNDRANQIIDAFDLAPEVEIETMMPNDPLTLEQLREMDGEPVWIAPVKGKCKITARWMLISGYHLEKDIYLFTPNSNILQGYNGKSYGKMWLAYRHKPEDGTT